MLSHLYIKLVCLSFEKTLSSLSKKPLFHLKVKKKKPRSTIWVVGDSSPPVTPLLRLVSLQPSLCVSFPDALGPHHRGSVLVSLARSLGEARRSVMLRGFFGWARWRRLSIWCQIWSLEVDILPSPGSPVPSSRHGGVNSLDLHMWPGFLRLRGFGVPVLVS